MKTNPLGIVCPILVLFVVLSLKTSPCFGQQEETGAAVESVEEESEEKIKAKKYFEQGIAFLKEENWKASLVSFEESLKVFPTASALFNKAMCLKSLHRYKESIADFEQYLDKYGEEVGQERLMIVKSTLEDLEMRLSTVTIEVNVDGARIYIDGKNMGESPVKGPIEVSSTEETTILITKDGYLPGEKKIRVPPGSSQKLEFELKPKPENGTLIVEANVEGARVILDGKELGKVPYKGKVQSGTYLVEINSKGHEAWSRTVIIETDRERTISATLSKQKGVNKGWFYGMLGVSLAGAAALGATGGMALHYNGKSDDARGSGMPDSEAIYDNYDKAQDYALGADICIGILGAAAITTLVLAFFTNWGKKPKKKESREALSLLNEINTMEVAP